jgi:hypothetical protein
MTARKATVVTIDTNENGALLLWENPLRLAQDAGSMGREQRTQAVVACPGMHATAKYGAEHSSRVQR